MLFIYFGVCTPSFAYANTCIRILVMCLLAGSGNVINDYFDQKVDTKNKPTSRIVGLLMKPQTAILYHAFLSLLALALALTLTIFNRDLFFVSSASVLIIALYFYTPLLKRIPFVGNIFVAACIAFIPVWTVWGAGVLKAQNFSSDVVCQYVFFAGWMTLIREGIKDLEDMEGDKLGKYTTLPLRYGVKWTKRYLIFLITIILLIMFFLSALTFHTHFYYSVALFLSAIPCFAVAAILSKAQSKIEFSKCANWQKISMIIGLLALLLVRFN